MKKYTKPLLLYVLLISAVLCFAACGNQSENGLSLEDLETTEYTNAYNGAVITVPADWQVQNEDEDSTVFLSSDGKISYSVQWELGGMSYFSKEELAGLAFDICGSVLTEPQIYGSWKLSDFDVAVKVAATGTTKDKTGKSVNAVCDVSVIQYFNDVRYYLVVATDTATYAEYENLFMDIPESFSVSLTEDEVYEKMNMQNENV